eukprot:UN01832
MGGPMMQPPPPQPPPPPTNTRVNQLAHVPRLRASPVAVPGPQTYVQPPTSSAKRPPHTPHTPTQNPPIRPHEPVSANASPLSKSANGHVSATATDDAAGSTHHTTTTGTTTASAKLSDSEYYGTFSLNDVIKQYVRARSSVEFRRAQDKLLRSVIRRNTGSGDGAKGEDLQR